MSDFVSVERIQTLKSGIETRTGKTYSDLTEGVQDLMDGYGTSGESGINAVLTDLTITENGEYTPSDGVDGFSKVIANIASSGDGSGSTNLFQTVDIIVDNTTTRYLVVDLDDATLDNYIIEAAVIQTGVYTDDVLTLDDVPTIPLSNNLPVQSIGVLLKNQLIPSFIYGTTNYSNALTSASIVVRGSVSTYGSNYVTTSETNLGKEGAIGIQSQYSWGKTGYYFKFRVNVYGWNNP